MKKQVSEEQMTNPVFAVITSHTGYKYQTDIVENEFISGLITDTALKHGVKYFLSKVYDARVFDWCEINKEQETNPDVIPDNYLDIYTKGLK